MKIITIINQKGGEGKTTTAHTLGAGLMLQGYNALLIDLDPQGSLTLSKGVKPPHKGTYELLQGADLKECITSLLDGDLIASNPMLSVLKAQPDSLKKALEPLRAYDYVIIDTPPALNMLTINALTAAHEVVITAQATTYSLHGIGQLYETIRTVQAHSNPNLTIGGILLTMHTERTNIGKELANMMKDTAGYLGTKVYTSTIRPAAAMKEAQALHKSIFEYAPKSKIAQDYQDFIKEIIK